MIRFLLVCVYALSAYTTVACDDVPYLQDVSFRSVFAGVEPAAADPASSTGAGFVSAAWDQIPFNSWEAAGMTKKNTVISVSSGSCMLALNQGQLYGMAEKTGAPLHEASYSAWTLLGDTNVADARAIIDMGVSTNGTMLYMPTQNNLARITLSKPSDDMPCGKVSDVTLVLDDDSTTTWGTVTGLQHAPTMDVLFIGSSDKGVHVVSLGDSKVSVLSHLDVAGDSSTSLLWVEKWNTLLTANDLAFYTLKFCPKKQVVIDEDHEWIGGVLGYTPTDLDYDVENDVVWIAENESIHKLTQDAVYWRMGYQQAAPMFNVSSVAVSKGLVFSGSYDLGMARVSGKQSVAQLDVSAKGNSASSSSSPPSGGADGDPWSWMYYFGPRWLPSNQVYAIIPTNQKDRKSVLVITSNGMTVLNLGEMTLKEKAAIQETSQEPRHDRHGLSTECNLKEAGVLSSWFFGVGDNDGLWTSMSAMGATYRYMHTKQEAARASAWRMFEGLELLSMVTGGYPHFTARSFSKLSDGDAGLPAEIDPTCVDDCWYTSPTMDGWVYKGDTSSDELSGHMAAYAMLYDHVAQTPKQKDRVLKLYDGLMSGIVDNDLYFIQPATGKRTLWGFWNPKEINDEPQHYSERGANSLQILGWLAQIYSVTGTQKYADQFWELVNDHKYVQNTLNVKIDSAIDENHSDTELIMLSYHAMYYAYERLPEGHERKEAVWAMVQPMLPSLQRTFLLLKGELSPLSLGIYAGVAAQRKFLNDADVEAVVWSLRHWQIDNIAWPIFGSQRIDLDISGKFLARLSDRPIMRHIRPPQERLSAEWNVDPFDVNPGGTAVEEYEPGIYLLPYYICAYHGLV